MAKFICNKLARDKTIEGMAKDAITAKYKHLNSPEYLEALKKKLLEESLEVTQATTRSEVVNELADVFEVIDAIKTTFHITHDEILTAKDRIFRVRGGFEKGVYLETIEMDENNPRVTHFRASPDRYPEVRSE